MEVRHDEGVANRIVPEPCVARNFARMRSRRVAPVNSQPAICPRSGAHSNAETIDETKPPHYAAAICYQPVAAHTRIAGVWRRCAQHTKRCVAIGWRYTRRAWIQRAADAPVACGILKREPPEAIDDIRKAGVGPVACSIR